MRYTTIKSPGGLSLNFSDKDSLNIDYCGTGGVYTIKEETSYLDDLLDDPELEESFDVNFFNTIATPVEEKEKPQFIIKEEIKEGFDINCDYSKTFVTSIEFNKTNCIDFGKFQDISGYIENQRDTLMFNNCYNMDDSLTTPVIDPNSSIVTNGPFYSVNNQINDELVCAPPDDICGGFSLPTTVNDSNGNELNIPITINNVINNNTPNTFNINQNIPINFVQPQQKMNENYYGNVDTYSAFSASSTPSVTPSSSSSSLIYTELQTRSITSTPDLMPTVINDHPYFTTRNNSFSRTVPSPSPSNSSMASGSTIDTNHEINLNILDLNENQHHQQQQQHSSQYHQPYSSMRTKNNEASRKSRFSKKQKLSDMLEDLRAQELLNEKYKKEFEEKTVIVQHLKNYLINVMKNGSKK